MRRFAALLTQPRRFFMVFVAAELLLAMAIPFMAIEGYHTLLDSRAGKFVHEPTRADPGWRAFVDPTPIVGVAEVDRGAVTGVALLVHHPEIRSAATVILVPGSLQLEGTTLSTRPPEDAVAAVGAALRLSIDRAEVLDGDGWRALLGTERYELDSPDPVDDESGQSLFHVGPVTVDGSNASAFLGRPAPGAAAISVQPRRHIFWNALLAAPPGSDSQLSADLRAMGRTEVQVVDLPRAQSEPVALIDLAAAELLIHDVVAYPAGAVPGDRLQVRILDRTGSADLEDIAAAVAARGMEVIEIGNALPFDDGDTQVLAPAALAEPDGSVPADLDDLSRSVGTTSVTFDNDAVDELVVTVVIGRHFDLANLY